MSFEKNSEKSSTPVQTEKEAPAKTISVVSEIDRSIMERVATQPKTLEAVDSIRVEKREDGKHRLSLPDELEPYKKKYAFLWILKHTRAIDEACQQYHWLLCNRTYFPDIPNYHFSASGVIERGDSVLAFRPVHIDQEMRRQPGVESKKILDGRFKAHENDAAFYTPSAEYEQGPDGKIKKVPVVGI